MKLFIDDERDPSFIGWDNSSLIARTGEEAIDLIMSNPDIDIISFDHDLGFGSLSGKEILDQLIDFELDTNNVGTIFGNKTILSHSMNPVGKRNILEKWNNYRDFLTDVYERF